MSLKISQMTNGNPAQTGDEIPINRGGANFSVTAASISALSGGGVPSGMNVWPGGYGGWVANNPQAVVVGGNTVANMLPGRLASSMPAQWKVSLKAFSGTCVLDAASIATCNADSETILSQTPITFGGFSPPVSFTAGITSDAIALQIDANHDYYLLLYFDGSSSDLLMWQSNIWADAPFGGIYSGTNMTTATSISDPSLTTDSYRFFYTILAA